MPGITKDIELAINEPIMIQKQTIADSVKSFLNSFFQPITFVSYDNSLREEDNNC